MRTIPAAVSVASLLGVAASAQAPAPADLALTGPILTAFGNMLTLASPSGTVTVDVGAATLSLDDRLEPRFQGLFTLTASEPLPGAGDTTLLPKKVVLHLPATYRPQFETLLSATQKNQCFGNLGRIENACKAWRELNPNSAKVTSLAQLEDWSPGLQHLRCAAGGRYLIGNKTTPTRCSLPAHGAAPKGTALALLAALPRLPEIDASVSTLEGTLYRDCLREPVFILITPNRAYRIIREKDTEIRLETDGTASPDGASATVTGKGNGSFFSTSHITLRVRPTNRAQAEARLDEWRRDECRAQLRQLEAAAEQWALDHEKPPTARPTWTDLVGPKRYLPRMLKCPSGGTYTLRMLQEGPACSVKGHLLSEQ